RKWDDPKGIYCQYHAIGTSVPVLNLRRCQAVAVAVKDRVPTPVFWLPMLAPPLGGGFFPQKINNHNEVSMNKNPFVKHRFAALGAIACLSLVVVGCGGSSGSKNSSSASSQSSVSSVSSSSSSAPATNWELVWSDEFEGDSIDTSKWGHEVNCAGGGNNELQCYTARSENSFV